MADTDTSQASISGDFDVKSVNQTQDTTTQALAWPSDVNCTFPVLMYQKPEVESSIQMSHDSTCKQIDVDLVDNVIAVKPKADYACEKTLSFRQIETENEGWVYIVYR